MTRDIKEIVPSGACLKCEVCCRYPEATTPFVPHFLTDEAGPHVIGGDGLQAVGRKADLKTPPRPYKDYYACRFFVPEKNACSIYASRPLDCRLYPFMVTYDRDYKSIVLALDMKCPHLKGKAGSPEVMAHADYLAGALESNDVAEEICRHKGFVNDYQEDAVALKRLENISRRFCLSGYGLTRISLKDKAFFDEYFSRVKMKVSPFSFPATYIWSAALNILWKEIGPSLCIFAGNDRDYFLLVPPVDSGLNVPAAKEAMEILSSLNGGGAVAPRMENVPPEFRGALESAGFSVTMASQEYIYDRKEMAGLKGDAFKSKRASVNAFVKNYRHACRPLQAKDIPACLELYRGWVGKRLEEERGDYFRILMEDSYFAQKIALFNMAPLGLTGRVVEVDGAVKGYSVGYPLNEEVFVILFETADLEIRGISQFIFREFSAGLANYKYINAMSDSGLEGLRRTKESYHPVERPSLFGAIPFGDTLSLG